MSAVSNNTVLGLTNPTQDLEKTVRMQDSMKSSNKSELQDKNKIDIQKIDQRLKEVDKSQERDKVKSEPLTPQQLEKVAQQLQDFVGEMNRGLQFSVDKDSGRDVIKVIDKSSGDLLKQYPSEEVLSLVSKLSEMVGGFVDAKV